MSEDGVTSGMGGLAGWQDPGPALQCNPTDNKPSGTSIILCGAAQPLPRGHLWRELRPPPQQRLRALRRPKNLALPSSPHSRHQPTSIEMITVARLNSPMWRDSQHAHLGRPRSRVMPPLLPS